jgi:hypothetical protein
MKDVFRNHNLKNRQYNDQMKIIKPEQLKKITEVVDQ